MESPAAADRCLIALLACVISRRFPLKRLALITLSLRLRPNCDRIGPDREPIRLANQPALSPDGSTLAFAWGGDIWTVPTPAAGPGRSPGTPPSTASPSSRPTASRSPSPATARAAFIPMSCPPKGARPARSGSTRPATASKAGPRRPIAAGRRLARPLLARRRPVLPAQDRGTIRRDAPLRRRRRERLALARRQAAAVHPRRRALVAQGISRLAGQPDLVVRPRVENVHQAARPPGGALWPLWRADGQGFYYVGVHKGSLNLREHDLKTGKDRPLTEFEDDSVVFPCISRDGSTIVFRHLFDFYRCRPGGSEPPAGSRSTTRATRPASRSSAGRCRRRRRSRSARTAWRSPSSRAATSGSWTPS